MIFFSRLISGFSNSKVMGLGFSFSGKGLKCERWVRIPPFTLGSGLSGHGWSCFFTFLIFATTLESLLVVVVLLPPPNRALPRVLRGMPLTPLLELRRRSEAEVPTNPTGECDIEAILWFPLNFSFPNFQTQLHKLSTKKKPKILGITFLTVNALFDYCFLKVSQLKGKRKRKLHFLYTILNP